MRTVISALTIMSLVMMLASCGTTAVNTPPYETWLAAQNLPSQLDVTGTWDAGKSWAGGSHPPRQEV